MTILKYLTAQLQNTRVEKLETEKQFTVRMAEEKDAEALLSIYSYYVKHTAVILTMKCPLFGVYREDERHKEALSLSRCGRAEK